MKYKTWLKFGFYGLLLGWFPFMWLSAWGSWNRDIGVFVLSLGIILCFFGSMMMMPLLRHEDMFKSIDELEEERAKYYKARKSLEKKIMEPCPSCGVHRTPQPVSEKIPDQSSLV